MIQPNEVPMLTDNGVAFTILTYEFTRHDCIISTEALQTLSKKQGAEFSPIEVFHAFEAKIRGVARRLVAAKVPGRPLRLEPRSFLH